MKIKVRSFVRVSMLVLVIAILSSVSRRIRADVESTGVCNGSSITVPFTDIGSSAFFCQIAEAYFSGLANGTGQTTYSPTDPVSREQTAAFVTRTMDQSLKRGSQRAALDQFWTTQGTNSLALTTTVSGPLLAHSTQNALNSELDHISSCKQTTNLHMIGPIKIGCRAV